MTGTVKLPVLGQTKKSYAIAGGAIVVVIVGYAYYRHSQNASASTTSSGTADTTSGNIDPATGYPSGSPEDTAALAAQSGTAGGNIDPLTGYPTGSPEDQQALAALNSGSAYGGYGVGYSGGGTVPPVPVTTTPTTTLAVPQIVGSGQTTAISAITTAGLTPFPSATQSGLGNVTSQSPAAGTQVQSGSTVYWDAKPKQVKNPATKEESFIANGQTSLNEAARIRKNTVDEVISATYQHNPGKLVHDYITRGNYADKLPRGSKWWFDKK